MRNTARILAVAGAVSGGLLHISAAGADPVRRIVLHTTYVEEPSSRQLEVFEKARPYLADVYAAIGVTVVWSDGPAARVTDTAMHITVVSVPSSRPTDGMGSDPVLRETMLGVAPLATGRVYVMWDRIIRRAAKRRVPPQAVLARVLAHEIGHHLLPGQGHTRSGLMTAALDHGPANAPAFSDTQVESILAMLTSSN